MRVSGLEICDSRVSLLTLKRTKNTLKVLSFVNVNLPAGVVENGEIKNTQALAKVLSEVKKSSKSGPYVILNIPENLVYITVRPFPNIDTNHIKDALELNLDEFVPGEKKDTYWGYQETSSSQNGKEVIIASVSSKYFSKYLEVLSEVGLIPVAIEPFSLASQRAFSGEPSNFMVALEKNSLTVAVLERGAVRFSAGRSYKTQEEAISFIKRSLDYYKAEKKIEKLSILLAGSLASPTVAQLVADKTNSELELASSKTIIKDPKIKSPGVIGSAIRGLIEQKDDANLSLLPVGTQESYEEKRALKFLGGLTNLVTITSALFLVLFLGFWGLLRYLGSSANNQIENLEVVQSGGLAEFQNNLKELSPRLAYIKESMTSVTSVGPEIKALNQSIIQGIAINGINMQKESKVISVSGTAESREILMAFKEKLENAKAFDKVDFASTNVGEANSSFSLNLTVKK